MFVYNILLKHNDKDIVNRIIELFPEEKIYEDGYYSMLEEMRLLPAWEEGTIVIEDNTAIYNDGDNFFSLEKVSWDSILGAEVIATCPPIDALAIILHEVSFYGFTQDSTNIRFSDIGIVF